MFLSQAIGRIGPSATLQVSEKTAQLRREGRTILNLAAGEPDFQTPDFIQKAASDAMQAGYTRYTPVAGLPQLREAVASFFTKTCGTFYAPEATIVSPGAKSVLFNAFLATLNPGDEVVIPAPYWTSYPDMVRFAGGVPCFVPCGEEMGFKLTPELLEEAITPRTKWLILSSPSNPTGAVYTKQELGELGEVLLKHPHVWVMSDEIYYSLTYDLPFISMAESVPALKDRLLIVNGVSKAYGMTGWRIGYGAGPLELIKAMSKLQSQSTSNPCSIAQMAALGALKEGDAFVASAAETFRTRRDHLITGLKEVPGLDLLVPPQGAFYLYVCCRDLIGRTTPLGERLESDQDVASFLLDEAGVSSVPGVGFGLSPYLRLSYASKTTVLTQACHGMREAILKLRD